MHDDKDDNDNDDDDGEEEDDIIETEASVPVSRDSFELGSSASASRVVGQRIGNAFKITPPKLLLSTIL